MVIEKDFDPMGHGLPFRQSAECLLKAYRLPERLKKGDQLVEQIRGLVPGVLHLLETDKFFWAYLALRTRHRGQAADKSIECMTGKFLVDQNRFK